MTTPVPRPPAHPATQQVTPGRALFHALEARRQLFDATERLEEDSMLPTGDALEIIAHALTSLSFGVIETPEKKTSKPSSSRRDSARVKARAVFGETLPAGEPPKPWQLEALVSLLAHPANHDHGLTAWAPVVDALSLLVQRGEL